jgi:hypothetical protein
MAKLLAFILAFLSCSNPGVKDPSPALLDQLKERTELYKDLGPTGFISTEYCDSLLFSALNAVARNERIDIEDAQGEPGQWFRRPSKDCYPENSKSTISRDMLLGVILYAVHFNEPGLLDDLWDYGEANNWVMGEGVIDRTLFTPTMIALLAEARYNLSGVDVAARFLAQTYDTTPGYRSHLSILKMVIKSKLGGLSAWDKRNLRILKEKNPTNPLIQAMYARHIGGDYTAALVHLLKDFPADRLPTTNDWCSEWRTQLKAGDNFLKPCPGNKTHSGGDFLFVSAIILGGI